MCGIVGIVSHNPVANILLKTLRRMEYRGYDSAGIGLVDKSNPLHIHKVIGSASGLSDLIKDDKSLVGIAHTRWATHGKPELRNAHPFKCGGVAIVHNGIIENHQELKDVLISQGHSFDSSTDSEVISHIFHDELKENSPIEALRNTCSMLKGAWAIGIVMETHPNMLLVARKGSPIIVAQGPSGNAIASDPTSLGGLFHEFYRLEDGDIAVLTLKNITIYNQDGLLKNDVIWSLLDNAYQDDVQGAYESFTRREISQQPESLHKTNDYLNERVIPEKFLSVDLGV